MASVTMREPVVSSPQPAITLQSGSAIEESRNSPRYDEKEEKLERETESTDEESKIGQIDGEEIENGGDLYRKIRQNESRFACGLCRHHFASPNELEIHKLSSNHEQNPSGPFCNFCNEDDFSSKEQFRRTHRLLHNNNNNNNNNNNDPNHHQQQQHDSHHHPRHHQRNNHLLEGGGEGEVEDRSSNHSEDCSNSNIRFAESNNSTNLSSSKSVESEGSPRTMKSLRSARRRGGRREGKEVKKSESDSESPPPPGIQNRRKLKTLNNNNNFYHSVEDDQFKCPVCERDLNSWNVLQVHLEKSHPDYKIRCDWCNLTFDSPRVLNLHRFMAHNLEEEGFVRGETSRKKLNFDHVGDKGDTIGRDPAKIIGFQDINFVDFSSEKFPLIAKNICEKRIHLSTDEFSFDCLDCGRGFPCEAAREIHVRSCGKKRESPTKKAEKKNKRKSTPKFHPQQSAGSDSDDSIENGSADRERKAFFDSLDLRDADKSPTRSRDRENAAVRRDAKTDLADIRSILSVAGSVPGLGGERQFANPRESPDGRDESNHPGLNLISPNFNVLNLVSPNHADLTEEEAQDCFAAECRRMKLRGEFPCKLCSAVFPNLRALKGHNRVHISVANGTPNCPYRCNICTYHSLDKATLVRHMRSHNGDRPYECAMCNYAFTTKANCERHLRNRHSKITREEVKSSIIYHPSEDPINDSEYQRTSEMNRRNLEKTREKQDCKSSLPINLKVNLVGLKETAKADDLFHAEHQQLIMNMKSEEENKRTETGTMTDMEGDGCSDWRYEDDSNEEALDLRIYKEKNYESDTSDVPQDLSKKEDGKEYNSGVGCDSGNDDREDDGEDEKTSVASNLFGKPNSDGKTNLDVGNLVKIYSNMYPSLNAAQIHQIILAQLNFPGILQKLQQNFPFPPFLVTSPMYSNNANNYVQKTVQKDFVGLQMSGGNILNEKNHSCLTLSEKLQIFHQQALAEIIFKREKDRMTGEFYGKIPARPTSEENLEKQQQQQKRFGDFVNRNDYFSEADKRTFGEILMSRRGVEEEKKREVSKNLGNGEKVIDGRNSSVKMVIKNGVLIPKQKQRRYRTERPFSCEHCSARFTLRSNMERHIKQQHPQHWTQKSRTNVGNAKRTEANPIKLNSCRREFEATTDRNHLNRYDVGKPISFVSRDNLNAGEIKWETSGCRLRYDGDSLKEDVARLTKAVEAEKQQQQRKRQPAMEDDAPKSRLGEAEDGKNELIANEEVKEAKSNRIYASEPLAIWNANSSKYLGGNGFPDKPETGNVKDEPKEELPKESQPQDLASVSRMLDNAVTQTQAFQKYFRDGGSRKDDEFKREKDEGERSEEEEGFVAGSTSSDENRSESEASCRSGKKKSAYSLAPNRVSCPYCFRKFPWTSSLRRHVLTHTGQKPFKCTHCPYLFTTKSNCDRHLLRKHGREALLASSGQTENPESSGNANVATPSNPSPNGSYPMRNVPERPYKCNRCPSSTFSTLNNLNKHLFSKHNGLSESSDSTPEAKLKNPQAPPNVTISPNFPPGLPRILSVVPQHGETLKTSPGKGPVNCKTATPTFPVVGVAEAADRNGSERDKPTEPTRAVRKRSSSEEMETTEKKRTSPDLEIQDSGPNDAIPVAPSELPFKCHLCDSSFGERSDALEHIRCQHPNEFQVLVSKGALDAATNTDEERHQQDDNDEAVDLNRGRFPDYANRKVMCAFCMRRFWSAEDLRRHMRTHTGERPFSCDVCQRRFTLKHSMLRHRKKHSPRDEVSVGSDEEHNQNLHRVNNNNISVSGSVLQKQAEDSVRRTILHQTLTRADETKDELREDPRISERVDDGANRIE